MVLARGFDPAILWIAVEMLAMAALLMAGLTMAGPPERPGFPLRLSVLVVAALLGPALLMATGRGRLQPAILLAAGIFGAIVVARPFFFKARWQDLWILVLGIFAALSTYVIVNAKGYATVFGDIQLLAGVLNKDTWFHTAIIAMLKNEGVSSIGLDGPVHLLYHVGFHAWISQLRFEGVLLPVSLAAAMQILFIPAIYALVALCCAAVPAARLAEPTIIVAWTQALLWMAAALVTPNHLFSESYAFSLAFMLAIVPIGLAWMQIGRWRKGWMAAEICVALPCIAFATVAKVSTGVVAATYLGLCLLLPPLVSRLRLLSAVIFAAGVLYTLGLGWIAWSDPPGLAFAHGNLLPLYPSMFATIAALSVVLGIFVVLGCGADRAERLAWTLLCMGLVLVSSTPGIFFALPAGSAYYFAAPPLVLFCGLAPAILVARSPPSGRWPPLLAPAVPAVLTCVFAGPQLKRDLHVIRIEKRQLRSDGVHAHTEQASRFLADAAGTSIERGTRRALVYVAPDAGVVWGWNKRPCWTDSFVVPALLGIPMLTGVRGERNGCPSTPFYGLADYGQSSELRPMTDKEVCAATIARGRSVAFTFRSAGVPTRLDCGVGSQPPER
ncbi:hypothetical protein WDZ92_19410 [Nostoc sp. NIES-2111]